MIDVCFRCPLPLVIKTLIRAQELGGQERPWHYPQHDPTRYTMKFVFADPEQGHMCFNEISKLIGRWEDENEYGTDTE